MADLRGLSVDFNASQDFRREGEDRSQAVVRRGYEAGFLEKADIAIDMGSGDNPNTRFVAMMNYDDTDGFKIQEMDSDLVSVALCQDNVHTLAEVSFGKGNQFAPYMDDFLSIPESGRVPEAVGTNIQEALKSADPAADVVVEKVAQDLSGVCSAPGTKR